MSIDEAEKIKLVVENKDYLAQLVNSVASTLLEAFENIKIEDVNMFQLGYNKAIDDFVKKIKDGFDRKWPKLDVSDVDGYALLYADCDIEKFIDELAEQLKEGD